MAAQDSSWNKSASGALSFMAIAPTGVEGQPGTISYSFYLMPASPNPVKGSAEFRFGLAKGAQASLGIYNVLGQRVKTLVNGNRSGREPYGEMERLRRQRPEGVLGGLRLPADRRGEHFHQKVHRYQVTPVILATKGAAMAAAPFLLCLILSGLKGYN